MLRLINFAIISMLLIYFMSSKMSTLLPKEHRIDRIKNLLYGIANFAAGYLLYIAIQILFEKFNRLISTIHFIQWTSNFLRIFLCILVADFCFYFAHLISHKVPIFWKTHLLHHLDVKVDFSTHYKHNYLNLLIFIPVLLIASWLTNLSLTQLSFFSGLIGLYQFFMHSPDWIWPTKLKYLIILPQNHRVHHQIDGQNKYYGGILSVWDQIFRSV